MIGATMVCVVACALLVAAEHQKWGVVRVIAKTIASVAFVAVALVALTCDASPLWREYQLYMIVGLVLGVVGDIALLGKSQGAFFAGLVAFLLGHIMYIVAFAQLAAPRAWLDVRALIPLVIGGSVLRVLWPRLGEMRVPVIAYVLAIVTMLAAAIAAGRMTTVPDTNAMLIVAGAALFFVSDLAVARDKFPRSGNPPGSPRSGARDPLGENPQGFVGASFVNRAWGLPAYYAGQLLLAWSLCA